MVSAAGSLAAVVVGRAGGLRKRLCGVVAVLGVVFAFFQSSGLQAETVAVAACLIASTAVGTVVYQRVERPSMQFLKRRAAIAA